MARRTWKRLWIVVAVIGIAGVFALAYAHNTGSRRTWPGQDAFEKYGFTEDQIKRFDEIRARYDEQTLELETELISKRRETEAYASRRDADRNRLADHRQELRTLERRIDDLWFDACRDARAILGSDQYAFWCDEYGQHCGSGCWWQAHGHAGGTHSETTYTSRSDRHTGCGCCR